MKGLDIEVTKIVNVSTAIEICCDGFEEQNHFCITRCPKCINGLCLKGTCVCQIGWNGPQCDTPTTGTTETAESSNSTNTPSTLSSTSESSLKSTTITYSNENGLISSPSITTNHLIFTENVPVFSNEELEGSGIKSSSPYEQIQSSTKAFLSERVSVEGLPMINSTESEESFEYPELDKIFEDPIAEENASASDYREVFDLPTFHNTVKDAEPKDVFEFDRIEFTEQSTTTTFKSVLIKPTNVVQDSSSKEDEISLKGNLLKSTGDFHDGKFERRSSHESFTENTKLTTVDETASKNLIYSICAASLTTFLILVIVVTLYAVKNSRTKMAINKDRTNVASVAVYRASIFHSPLPDPPMFDNPTYMATKPTDDNWNIENQDTFEAHEFNIAFHKPLRTSKLACKQYLYDHPPSTGSYRASSEVDTLSQYTFMQKSSSSAIIEPLYDEIPAKEEIYMNTSTSATIQEINNTQPRSTDLNIIDSNQLYMNTCIHTKF
ncbi:uncharacterized protein [Euwallacea fornicatus]|uniref:uncharacterized protein isoform X2 n=1 Tax=Euwallacea fornicatus TaxID=995702 RepID=UPI00338E69C2